MGGNSARKAKYSSHTGTTPPPPPTSTCIVRRNDGAFETAKPHRQWEERTSGVDGREEGSVRSSSPRRNGTTAGNGAAGKKLARRKNRPAGRGGRAPLPALPAGQRQRCGGRARECAERATQGARNTRRGARRTPRGRDPTGAGSGPPASAALVLGSRPGSHVLERGVSGSLYCFL